MLNHVTREKITHLNEATNIIDLIKEKKLKFVTFDDWLKIDAYENEMGKASKKVKSKISSRNAFFSVLNNNIKI